MRIVIQDAGKGGMEDREEPADRPKWIVIGRGFNPFRAPPLA